MLALFITLSIIAVICCLDIKSMAGKEQKRKKIWAGFYVAAIGAAALLIVLDVLA